MNRILATGGGGFGGNHLARELYHRGNLVRVVDIKFDGYIKERYYSEKMRLDLRKRESCLRATKDIDEVYNLAANMGGIGFITAVGAEVMHDNMRAHWSRYHVLVVGVRMSVGRFLVTFVAWYFNMLGRTWPHLRKIVTQWLYPQVTRT